MAHLLLKFGTPPVGVPRRIPEKIIKNLDAHNARCHPDFPLPELIPQNTNQALRRSLCHQEENAVIHHARIA
jgi:hypothetical protein